MESSVVSSSGNHGSIDEIDEVPPEPQEQYHLCDDISHLSNALVERRIIGSLVKYSEAVVLRMKKIIFTQDISLLHLQYSFSMSPSTSNGPQRPSAATRPSPSELPSPPIPTALLVNVQLCYVTPFIPPRRPAISPRRRLVFRSVISLPFCQIPYLHKELLRVRIYIFSFRILDHSDQ